MENAQRIIDRFGGLTKTARALGHRHVTTVQGWKNKGSIPSWRMFEIEAAADRLGIDLDEDLEPAE